MREHLLAFFLIFLFVGCGEVTPESSNEPISVTQYILIQPTNPPFIQFGDQNIGVIPEDEFQFEEDVEFPTNPIPTMPEIF